MAHGNVYAAEKVDAALANYFRVGNLGALRELALLWVADRVDEGLEEYRERHGITAPWETRERVVVALTGAPDGDRLVRRGARLAARTQAELVGVHVRSADGLATPNQELLERHRALLEQLGGRYAEVTGTDVADALVRFARAENSHADRPRRDEALALGRDHEGLGDQPSDQPSRRRSTSTSSPPTLRRSSSHDDGHWRSAVACSCAGRRGRWPSPGSIALVITPLYALGAARRSRTPSTPPGSSSCCCSHRSAAALVGGLYPALVAAAVAFLVADWFCTSTRRAACAFARVGDLVALVVFVAVAAVVSVLVDRLAQAHGAGRRGQAESEALAGLVHGTAVFDADALARLVTELRRTFGPRRRRRPAHRRRTGGELKPCPVTRSLRRPTTARYAAELRAGTMLVVAGPPLPAGTVDCSPPSWTSCASPRRHSRLQTEAAEGGRPRRGERSTRRPPRRRVP